ncbi:hypothetical protein [Nostoc sp.]|uniref:hypothetical protein n=1 Tax=Nostoc sp. TaxID=1180 RepID=UPI002FF6219A
MKRKANILYIYADLAELTLEPIKCQILVNELKEYHNVTLHYAIVSSIENYPETTKRQFITEEEFENNNYDILIIENKLKVISQDESEKVKSEILLNFRKNGGIVVFMCSENGQPFISTYNDFLRKALLPIIRHPISQSEFPDGQRIEDFHRDFINCYDEQNKINNKIYYFSLKINEKYLRRIDESIRSVFKDVQRLVVNSPIQVDDAFRLRILLPGNTTTIMITSSDLRWDGAMYPILGSYNDIFGVGVLITGDICLDSIVKSQKTDAIRFMLNLVNLLWEKQQQRSQIFNSSLQNQDSQDIEEDKAVTLEAEKQREASLLFPMEIVQKTRDYINKVAYQANECYKQGLYDACAVMVRRLIETLIIECYEHHKIDSKIKNKNGDFFALKDLISKFLSETEWNVSRSKNLEKIADIKVIGDLSAHNRRYNARDYDINKVKADIRIAVEELVYIAGFDKTKDETIK